VNVAEATLPKQVDLQLCSSVDIGTIRKKVYKNTNHFNMLNERLIW
jgi:hypothetical protein